MQGIQGASMIPAFTTQVRMQEQVNRPWFKVVVPKDSIRMDLAINHSGGENLAMSFFGGIEKFANP